MRTEPARRGHHAPKWLRPALSGLAAFGLGTYPLSVILRANAGAVPLEPATVIKIAGTVGASTAALIWGLRFVERDVSARALAAGIGILIFTFYPLVTVFLRVLGVPLSLHSFGFAAAYVVAAGAIPLVLLRKGRLRTLNPVGLLIVATVFLGANYSRTLSDLRTGAVPVWKDVVSLRQRIVSGSAGPSTNKPDIYYIVLDAFGRTDVLSESYGVNLESVVSTLRTSGFQVPRESRSNYAQTYFALASLLNFNYLDDFGKVMGPRQDRRVLKETIEDNLMMAAARHAGYRVVAIGSDYRATEDMRAADVCVCAAHGFDDIERGVIGLTPLVAFPLDYFTYDAHRRNVRDAFGAVRQAADRRQPTFVFAHILSPHPPFVFHADGTPRKAEGYFPDMFGDGSHFPGSREQYVTGYSGQVQFIAGEMVGLVADLLKKAGPTPVIVIHGDHGPGSELQLDDPTKTNMRERMSIFAAYLLPGGPVVPDTITPVNGARLLATTYLGLNLPPLPERAMFSTWNHPYQFIDIPAPASDSTARPPF